MASFFFSSCPSVLLTYVLSPFPPFLPSFLLLVFSFCLNLFPFSPYFFLELGRLGWYSDGPRAGRLEFDSLQGKEIFLFSTAFRSALWSKKHVIYWVTGMISYGSKWPECEVHLIPPSNAKVKHDAIPLLPHTSSRHNA